MIDAQRQFPEMLQRTETAIRNAFPISSRKGYELSAKNWRWTGVGDEVKRDIAAHKNAKLKDGSITAKLVADLTIKDVNGKVVDVKQGSVVMTVPHITAKSSYIVKGKEIQVVNQLRLRPGLYTRFTVDNNIETFVNTSAAGTYRVLLDREKGKFLFRVGSSAHFALPVVLRALGVSDISMQKAWGQALFRKSMEGSVYEVVLKKLFARLRPNLAWPPSTEEAARVIADFLDSKPLDPKVNNITIGASHSSVTGSALLDASRKCLSLSRDEVSPDDTEDLAFKSIHSVEDFVGERVTRALPMIVRAIQAKMDRDPKIELAAHAGLFSDPVTKFFTTSEFARHTDQTNPVDMVSTNFLTTTMGEGGISSTHAVTEGVRLVHPSHIGVLDPLHTPEGQKIGITGHLTLGAKKVGNEIHIPVISAKTGKREVRSLKDLSPLTIAFPDQYDLTVKPPKPKSKMVKGRRKNELNTFPASEVDYLLTDSKAMFSPTSNMVPFLHNNDGNRVGMADRHIEQTIPLVDPDRPRVQARFGSGGYEDRFGEAFLPKSPVEGTVTKVTKEVIEVRAGGKTHAVPIHDHYPLNSNVFLTDRPVCKVGDKVKKGQVLVENNFTKGKSLAMGKNLSIAYMPYKGRNFEDGIVISEGAAKKLTSAHKYEYRLDRDKTIKVGLDLLLAHFPDQQEKVPERKHYDQDGVIKEGTQVVHGQLLIPAVREQELHEDYDYAKLHRALSNQWVDQSIYWDHDHVGKVMSVTRQHGFIKVLISTEEEAQIGDKLSMRHGGKGIVTAIIPDNEMYQDSKGAPLDVLFNPTGVPGRVNPGQLFEAAAGKMAKEKNRDYIVDNFGTGESTLAKVKGDLRAAGMDENGEETVTDPTTGRKFDGVLVGDTHFLKLKHLVSKKFSARSVGDQYTVNEQPAKTDEGSAQSIGGLELYSLLSGDATKFVDDAFSIKGQKNDEYWRALQLGLPLPKTKPPFVAEKFHTYLLGAGISLQRNGDKIKALPLTDKEIRDRSNGEIEEPTVVTANDLKPEKRGLFDPAVTGGIGGEHWAHIELAEPIVNPLMVKPCVSVLDIKAKELTGLMEGSLGLKNGRIVENDGKLPTGGEAIESMLKDIDVARELKLVDAEAATTKSAAKRDKLNKRRRYLLALKKMGMTPADAYVNHTVPVVPPKFRSLYPLPDGSLNVSDPVHGYREVLLVSNMMKEMKAMGVDAEHIRQLRGDLHKSVAGLVGTMEPLTREAHFKGFLSAVKGSSPKTGFFQSRVMRRQQDLSARSTVIPDPKLGLDEVGMPKKMGLKIYKPFLVRRLVQLGHDPLEARKMVEEGHEQAVKVLGIEIQERPAFMNRAPSLHKFNVLAFKPRLVDGEAIQVNPLIVGGYNMDFDGDTVGLHVPVSEEARVEALEKMLPSMNLFSPASNRVVHTPSMETVLGLYLMSNPKGVPRPAGADIAVLKEYTAKRAKINDAFKVGKRITCPGQVLVNRILPAEFRFEGPMTKKQMVETIEAIAKKHPKKAPDIINKLKDLGNHYVTEVGFSVSLRDLEIDNVKRDAILLKAERRGRSVGFETASKEALEEIGQLIHSNGANRFVELSTGSGALGGKAGSVNRMLASPVAVTDHRGQAIPVQIKKSYAEGHDMGSYWATLPGARKGMMDKGLATADTGYLTKRLVQSNIDVVVTEPDCRTMEGVWMTADDPDILDRVGAQGAFRNQTITSDVARKLKGRRIMVRSPLKCRAKSGLCQKCFGLSEKGQFYPVGFHLGILAAQTIGEPSTQLALRTFHTGGALGGQSGEGFPRVDQIFSLPDNVKNKAVLAMAAGSVTRIDRASAGGWTVWVGEHEHYIPQELGLDVRRGQTVRAGQKLSKGGVLRPQDLLSATGSVDQVRDAMIGELDANFRSSGVKIKRRIFETAIRPLTSWARVTDAGDGVRHGIHQGDVVQVNRLDELNKKLKKKIEFETQLVGVAKVPHLGDDFIGRLMHDRIMDTLKDAPALGLNANMGPNGHPVTQLALRGVRDVGTPAKVPRTSAPR